MRLFCLAYRAHNPRWAWAPLSGQGAAIHGGRFNKPGIQALYTSLRPETAWLEAQQAFPFKPQPLTLCAYRVDCADIVDLTDPGTCATLGIAPDQLACAWDYEKALGKLPFTWTLAERLVRAGNAGIKVRSFAPGATREDCNAIFWHWGPILPHKVVVIDDEARLSTGADAG